MVRLGRALWFAAFAALGAGFVVLAGWSMTHGIAAGRVGLALRGDHPGTFWFIVALQLVMASAFGCAAVRQIDPRFAPRRAIRAAFAVVLVLGVWMAWDVGSMLFWIALGAAAPDRWIYAALGAALVAVIVSLGYQLVWKELADRS